ncbi:hypothetical protein Holit_03062 [Hollandina sp. SP2]
MSGGTAPPVITQSPTLATDRYISLGTAASLPDDDTTLTVNFNLLKLQTLINAEKVGTTSTLSLYTPKVRLLPRYNKYPFVPIDFSIPTTTGISGNGVITDPYIIAVNDGSPQVSVLPFVNNPTTTTGKLPKESVDGLLQFELTYRAFGVDKDINEKATTKWIIRNGLERSEDAVGTSGGHIVVKIGAGSPVDVVVPTEG